MRLGATRGSHRRIDLAKGLAALDTSTATLHDPRSVERFRRALIMSTTTRHSIQLADGDAGYRQAAWREVMSPSGEVLMSPEEAERFTTEGRWRQIGPLLVGHVTAGDFRLVRTKAAAERIGLDHVFINVFLAGRGEGVCGRRRMRFEPGAMSITKLSSPADYRLEGITLTALVVPRRLLEAAMGPIGPFDGRVYPPNSVEALLVGAHIEGLLAMPDPLPPAKVSIASRSSLTLLAACLSKSSLQNIANTAAAADDEAELAKAVRRYIKERLADPDLGPDLICRQFALSRARLYRLMRDGGNIAATIRRLRLARAHGEITAGRHADLTSAAVAARFGFRQERSFRRAFVQEFSVSPAALRSQARTGLRVPLPEAGLVIVGWFNEL
ncbi:helix-turn-helix domain-containing protein [Methylobacterium sp. Leaf108]|uniref:AraC-like ligand-binding domain-containing protein n=1 Tax=Methylobacterium sp. Leaf108 TaxID=1736256 RepID=UPI0006F4821C|nr:helix-turn-helix domain-containing protein [Methylobacterium sp. Leaf108]KQP59154.1 hypothetical protein ASF39_16990 [Methylobacterium sp. Leaf108]